MAELGGRAGQMARARGQRRRALDPCSAPAGAARRRPAGGGRSRSFSPASPRAKSRTWPSPTWARWPCWAGSTPPAWRSRPIRSARQPRRANSIAVGAASFAATGGVASSTLVRTVLGSAAHAGAGHRTGSGRWLCPAARPGRRLVSQAGGAEAIAIEFDGQRSARADRRRTADRVGQNRIAGRCRTVRSAVELATAGPQGEPLGAGTIAAASHDCRRPPGRIASALVIEPSRRKSVAGRIGPPMARRRMLVDRPSGCRLGMARCPHAGRSAVPGRIRRRSALPANSRSLRDSLLEMREAPLPPGTAGRAGLDRSGHRAGRRARRPKPCAIGWNGRASWSITLAGRRRRRSGAGRAGRDLRPRTGTAFVLDHGLRLSADRSVSRSSVWNDQQHATMMLPFSRLPEMDASWPPPAAGSSGRRSWPRRPWGAILALPAVPRRPKGARWPDCSKAIFVEFGIMQNLKNLRIKIVDAPLDAPADALADQVLAELASGNLAYEVAYVAGAPADFLCRRAAASADAAGRSGCRQPPPGPAAAFATARRGW